MIFHIKCRKFCYLLLNKSVIINQKFILVTTRSFFNSVEVQFRDYLRSGINFAVLYTTANIGKVFQFLLASATLLRPLLRLLAASSRFRDNSERKPSITWRDWSEEEKVEDWGKAPLLHSSWFSPFKLSLLLCTLCGYRKSLVTKSCDIH